MGWKLNIKKLRKERNISQIKLAIDLNMSQNTISRYETGERQAGYAELVLLSRYFRVPIDELIIYEDDE